MDRFERSVQLAKASWDVLRGDKQLIWLPVLSGLTTLIVMVTFLVPAAIVAHDAGTGGFSAKPVAWVLGAIGYLVLTYVVVFFNAALVWAADGGCAASP